MLASGRSGARRGGIGGSGRSYTGGVLTMALFRHHVSAGLPLLGGVTIYVAASIWCRRNKELR